ncbi:MAG: restriction endonuclease subunit S [Candidatus Gastranaerophilaceae bacterium]
MSETLKTISNIITGHVFRSKIQYTTNGNVNLLNMESVSEPGFINIIETDVKKVLVEDLKSNEILKSGDILFKAKGLNNTAVLIGNVPDNTTVTASCHIIRVADSNFLLEFVCTWLNSSAAKKHFSKGAGQATGVTIASVSKATLESLEIPQLPLKEQKLISKFEKCANEEKKLHLKIAEKKELLNRAIIEKELQKY